MHFTLCRMTSVVKIRGFMNMDGVAKDLLQFLSWNGSPLHLGFC